MLMKLYYTARKNRHFNQYVELLVCCRGHIGQLKREEEETSGDSGHQSFKRQPTILLWDYVY